MSTVYLKGLSNKYFIHKSTEHLNIIFLFPYFINSGSNINHLISYDPVYSSFQNSSCTCQTAVPNLVRIDVLIQNAQYKYVPHIIIPTGKQSVVYE